MKRAAPLLLLAAALLLPAWPLFQQAGVYLADPLSELPVKLWAFETFAEVGLIGGNVDTIGFPNVGPLNNPDLAGALFTAIARPLLGRAWSYDALVIAQLGAAMLGAWALARDHVEDRLSAVIAGVAFGLAPILLAYCVAGAVTDMLNLWPWPLAARSFLRGSVRDGAIAGGFTGLGFVLCPYNAVVFVACGVPMLVLARGRLGALAAAAAVSVGIAGLDAGWLWSMAQDPSSQMSSGHIMDTRHAWPFASLHPEHAHRYVAFLSDYLADQTHRSGLVGGIDPACCANLDGPGGPDKLGKAYGRIGRKKSQAYFRLAKGGFG